MLFQQIHVGINVKTFFEEMASYYEAWKGRQAGRRVLLALAGICFTFTFCGSYHYIYKPWTKRITIMQAKQYAEFLESHQK